MEDPNTTYRPGSTGADQYAPAASQAQSATNKTADTGASVKDAVGDAAGSAKEAAGDAVGQAKDQATSLLDQAKDKALGAASDQKDGLADTLDGLAQSVHKSGEQFAGQQDWIAGAIERGATELSSLATSLRDNDLSSLVDQVKSLARRQPAVFVGACLAGGFAIARLGKIVAADVSRDDLPTMPEVGHGSN